MATDRAANADVLKALGDPIRWEIVQQMADEGEVAASTLEDRLPIAKPTISYHVRILTQAGLIDVRKQGRNYFYALRRSVLTAVLDDLASLLPGTRIDGNATSAGTAKPINRDDEERLVTW